MVEISIQNHHHGPFLFLYDPVYAKLPLLAPRPVSSPQLPRRDIFLYDFVDVCDGFDVGGEVDVLVHGEQGHGGNL